MPIKKYFKRDVSLDTLLDLDGEIFPMDNGYRILGFDNAHAHKTKRKKYRARKVDGLAKSPKNICGTPHIVL